MVGFNEEKKLFCENVIQLFMLIGKTKKIKDFTDFTVINPVPK